MKLPYAKSTKYINTANRNSNSYGEIENSSEIATKKTKVFGFVGTD
jgi:hypothetical protein